MFKPFRELLIISVALGHLSFVTFAYYQENPRNCLKHQLVIALQAKMELMEVYGE